MAIDSATTDSAPAPQDFTKKIAIVLRKGLEPWVALNAAAHIAAYIGNRMTDRFDTGEFFTTRDGRHHPRNAQYPIVTLTAPRERMRAVMDKTRASGLLYHGFIREMIETTDDEAIARIVREKLDAEMEYLGIGVFGPIEQVNAITKNLSLWKGA